MGSFFLLFLHQRFDPSGFHRSHQCRVVFLILVRVARSELADGLVEGVRFAQIAADRRRIPGFRVGVGQGPTAQFGVQHMLHGRGPFDLGGHLHVPQLAHIEISSPTAMRPAKENIAGGLHQPLTRDDPLPVILVLTFARIGLEHGGTRFLELQQQGVILRREKQAHKTVGADAADAHRFDGDVFEAIAVKKHPAFIGQASSVPRHGVKNNLLKSLCGYMKQHRRLIDQPPPPTHLAADLRVEVIADALLGLCDNLFPKLS